MWSWGQRAIVCSMRALAPDLIPALVVAPGSSDQMKSAPSFRARRKVVSGSGHHELVSRVVRRTPLNGEMGPARQKAAVFSAFSIVLLGCAAGQDPSDARASDALVRMTALSASVDIQSVHVTSVEIDVEAPDYLVSALSRNARFTSNSSYEPCDHSTCVFTWHATDAPQTDDLPRWWPLVLSRVQSTTEDRILRITYAVTPESLGSGIVDERVCIDSIRSCIYYAVLETTLQHSAMMPAVVVNEAAQECAWRFVFDEASLLKGYRMEWGLGPDVALDSVVGSVCGTIAFKTQPSGPTPSDDTRIKASSYDGVVDLDLKYHLTLSTIAGPIELLVSEQASGLARTSVGERQ